jgi:hypothetical protein
MQKGYKFFKDLSPFFILNHANQGANLDFTRLIL